MSTFDEPALLDALSAPLGDLISAVGTSVAEAQRALDAAAIATLQDLYQNEDNYLLQSIGYRPTWYQIPQVDAEINMALTLTGNTEQSGASRSRVALYAAPVDASYTNRFGFELQAASKVSFKIVPVPPSIQAEAMQAVPPLVGRTLRQALGVLRALNIAYEHPDPADLEARVIHQSPNPGAILAPDERVVVDLALCPDVMGLTIAEARTRLAGELLDIEIPSDAFDYSVIVAQNPKAYAALAGNTVTVSVLRAPALVGLSLADARPQIEALGLILVTGPSSDQALITGQSPTAGLLLDPESPMTLTSATPNVVGKTLHEARLSLSEIGVLASATAGTDPTALVSSQTPTAGSSIEVGQMVALSTTIMPNLVGSSLKDAVRALDALGVGTEPINGDSEQFLVGRHLPSAGAAVGPDTRVQFIQQTVPNVVSASSEEAAKTLRNAGLAFSLPRDYHPDVRVEVQTPAAGEPASPKTEVVLELYLVPKLEELTFEDAAPILKERGMPWKSNTDDNRQRVVAQIPEAGKPLQATDKYVQLTLKEL